MRPNIDDVSKLLTRQVLGTDLPKFSGDPKEWPTTNDHNVQENNGGLRIFKQ
jgi:hypothetical protein